MSANITANPESAKAERRVVPLRIRRELTGRGFIRPSSHILPPPPMLFFFDYADPLCWVVEELLARSDKGLGALQRFPFESGRLNDEWENRTQETAEALGAAIASGDGPCGPVNPQKGFELAFHGAESGCFESVHRAIFEAHFASGRDIGRIDELVDVATAVGLDASETKAVLDVDRHAEAVRAWRDRAVEAGVATTPTIVRDGERFEGRDAIREVRRWLTA